jgi:molybdate transport system substrate-binding protein
VPIIAALAGCGDDSSQLTVFGASSLQDPFTRYAESFPDTEIRQSFAGSDQLAAQIRNGSKPDVYAAASTEYPAQLYREGLTERPLVFAANRLVIAVPAESTISSIADLADPGEKLAIGDSSVPVGSYTREVLGRLPAGERGAILDNVRSEEPEVSSIAAKIVTGAADAGFVYVTDVRAAGEDLRPVRIPPRLQPDVAYAAAVVRDSDHRALAGRFVAGLRRGAGARELREAGFLPPP